VTTPPLKEQPRAHSCDDAAGEEHRQTGKPGRGDDEEDSGGQRGDADRGEPPKRFDCYPSGTVILGQLGVLANLGAVLQQPATAS
jgi:hypothetical protein